MTKKEKIYVITQFLVSFTGATWFQMAYNEPAMLVNRPLSELVSIVFMSLLIALTNTGITWLSYLSDPKAGNGTPPIEAPPVVDPPIPKTPFPPPTGPIKP